MIIFLLTKFLFAVEVSYIENICIYGYSFTILAPVMLLCLIPIEIVKWVALGYGLFHSTMFLVYNMYKTIEEKAEKSKYVILGLIIVFQVALYLVMKFYFFSSLYEKPHEKLRNLIVFGY